MTEPSIIMPIARDGFDPSEVAIPWQILTNQGYRVEFATIDGRPGHADAMMLSGEGLDPWGWIPLLKKIRLIGLLLRANGAARAAYQALLSDAAFKQPKSYAELNPDDYAGLFLPGGHAKSTKDYLESKPLQQFVATFFDHKDSHGNHKPVGAVCHGVLVAARAISPNTGHSVLYGKKTTALTWKLEKAGWQLTRFFARFWDPHYYRTYVESGDEPTAYWSVESEVKRALKSEQDFIDVAKDAEHFWLKTAGLSRDRPDNDKPAWVVQDGNYLSARWPGDIHTLSQRFAELLEPKQQD